MAYDPIEHLTLKTQFATQYDGAVNGYWTGTYSQYGQGVNKPYASRSEGYNQNWVWDNTITYENTFAGNHKLSVIGLFSMQKGKHMSSGMTGEGLPYDSDWHAIQTAEQITNVNSGYWESAMVSLMGRVNYVFKDRYLFTVTARYDGTSRLARKNRWVGRHRMVDQERGFPERRRVGQCTQAARQLGQDRQQQRRLQRHADPAGAESLLSGRLGQQGLRSGRQPG